MTVKKSNLEQNGGTYRQVGDCLMPNLELSAEEKEVHVSMTLMLDYLHIIIV